MYVIHFYQTSIEIQKKWYLIHWWKAMLYLHIVTILS